MPTSRRRQRRGVATLWTIVTMLAVLALMCLVVEIGNLWLARAELENAMEAAALAAVDRWGDDNSTVTSTWTSDPRDEGVAFAGANTVIGELVVIDDNLGAFNGTTNPNENADSARVADAPLAPPGALICRPSRGSPGFVVLNVRGPRLHVGL